MNCENCTVRKAEPVPYIVHEGVMARMERTIKRLWILVIVLILVIVSTVGVFVWYLNQYDFESYTYEQDGQGVNIIGSRNGVDFNVPEDYCTPTD